MSGRTATMPMVSMAHEELLEVRDESVAYVRARVVFENGPREGDAIQIDRSRISVGGRGSTIELDMSLPMNAMFVRVVRGRPMVEPGHGAAFLEDQRVREITPVMPGEIVRLGDVQFRIEPYTVEEQGKEREGFGAMVGSTPQMRKLFGTLMRMAAHDAPVLLTGESGTGKELAAAGLHEAGPRAEGPFVAINCAAVADTLFESELFGHEKGAFTGATARADGAFQRADGGTLFLDEVGEMRLDLQAKLLRTLESGEVRRIGGHEPTYPDVRVVAATNRHLPSMIREGTFRQDLYYRLEVLTVRLPPLRERREDIPAIAKALLRRNHPSARLSPDAVDALVQYDWPGNIRELRNVLTRAFVMAGDQIGVGDLTFNPWAFEETQALPAPLPTRGPEPTRDRDADERGMILVALQESNGNRTAAARALGMPRSSLLYKLKRLKIVYPA
jgi:transcriptional regulator with PAS, ATPase and Fis domain